MLVVNPGLEKDKNVTKTEGSNVRGKCLLCKSKTFGFLFGM
jgi:hypothetical protein